MIYTIYPMDRFLGPKGDPPRQVRFQTALHCNSHYEPFPATLATSTPSIQSRYQSLRSFRPRGGRLGWGLAMTRILSVVGARPNFMKIAPIAEELKKYPGIEHCLVHSGQHYDELLSGNFFTDLNLPKPDMNLQVGSGSQAAQTAEIMKRIEPVLLEYKPQMLLVVGDVNSTLAAALTAVKLRIPIAHIEAGLRSFDMTMPEEVNRRLTDAISDLLFVTEKSGVENLKHEGVPEKKIFLVGNVMIDCLLRHRELATRSPILDRLGMLQNGSGCRPYGVL